MELPLETAAPDFAPIRVVVPASGRERAALWTLRLGALAVVLAATTDMAFELDRFFIPKELVLHLTALLAALLAAAAFRRAPFTVVDVLLAGFLLLSALSALTATNRWLATRALALSVSGVALFWAARGVREAGLARPLCRALAFAVVVGAGTCLLQTYGVRIDFFSVNRAPGGTLGNRNFVAHMAAFGLPVLLLSALRAWRGAGFLAGALGVAVVTMSLVLTRSRAGWLAAGVAMLVLLLAMVVSRPLRRHGRSWRRFAGILIAIGAGVAAAVLVPNSLRWRSENPYLESVRGVTNYQEGSGAGRLVQYQRSLRMAVANPLLGAGPGNWPVEYPEYAARNDPSLDGNEPGTTSNPWPSSDWVAFVAERGPAAAIVLALAFLGIAFGGLRRLLSARDEEEGMEAAALVATLGAALTAGLFDAVLLLALPTLIVWAALGALWSPAPTPVSEGREKVRRFALLAVVLVAGLGALRSAGQVAAMRIYTTTDRLATLENAALLDPGNYRVHLRLARGRRGEQRCEHAGAAHALLPNAAAARSLNRGCDE